MRPYLHSESTLSAFSIIPYENCNFKCKYCYLTNIFGDRFGRYSKARPEVVSEIKAKRFSLTDQSWILSAHTDPYPPAEKNLKLSRECLETLLHIDSRGVIATKSTLIQRDCDIIKSFGSRVNVSISLGTDLDSVSKQLEPGAHPPSARLQLVRHMRQQGISVRLLVAPVLKHSDHFAEIIAELAVPVFIETTPEDCWSIEATEQDKNLLNPEPNNLAGRLSDIMPSELLHIGKSSLQVLGQNPNYLFV